MDRVTNRFERSLAEGKPQNGLWAALADRYVTEVLATAGFDWLLIDNEHAPNDVRSTLAQLQAMVAYSTHSIVRPVKKRLRHHQAAALSLRANLAPADDRYLQSRRETPLSRHAIRRAVRAAWVAHLDALRDGTACPTI